MSHNKKKKGVAVNALPMPTPEWLLQATCHLLTSILANIRSSDAGNHTAVGYVFENLSEPKQKWIKEHAKHMIETLRRNRTSVDLPEAYKGRML